jgi:hypothetical protein
VAERAKVESNEVVKFNLTCRLTPDEPAN